MEIRFSEVKLLIAAGLASDKGGNHTFICWTAKLLHYFNSQKSLNIYLLKNKMPKLDFRIDFEKKNGS